jgi:hypothetical protein
MDEEDGRPGPGAWKSGLADVRKDAFMGSLCHPSLLGEQVRSLLESQSSEFFHANRLTQSTHINSRAFSAAGLPRASTRPQVEE